MRAEKFARIFSTIFAIFPFPFWFLYGVGLGWLREARRCSNINTGNRRFPDLAWFRNTGSRVYTFTPRLSVLARVCRHLGERERACTPACALSVQRVYAQHRVTHAPVLALIASPIASRDDVTSHRPLRRTLRSSLLVFIKL